MSMDTIKNLITESMNNFKLMSRDVDTLMANFQAINKSANPLIKLGKIEEHLYLFKKAMKLHPNFKKALQLEPNNFRTITNYANPLIILENLEASVPLFEKPLLLESDNIFTIRSDAYLSSAYALMLMKSGIVEESCQFFDEFLELKDNNYVRYKYATALEELGQYKQAIEQLEKINLTNLSTYSANVIRLTLGRLYYYIKLPGKGNQYFQEAIDISYNREKTLIYSAINILANSPYDKKAIEILHKIPLDSPHYPDALEMLNLNLDSEEYYNRIDSETNLKDTQMLNRGMYHKIHNEIALLKSIAYRILRNYQDENYILNNIIEKLEDLVEKIAKRREIQQEKIDKIPEDDYREILSIISQTAHDISDVVNNGLALIELKTRRGMRKIDSESKIYSQFEKLLTQLEFTQAALNDLKAINEGINIKNTHFPVKQIFEKWQANNKIENAEIQLEITNGNSEFYADEEKIKSSLNEMVENSLKHNSYQQHLIIKMKSQDV
ncbi:MAG: histidine kinase, partial [Okeania sp. SIO2D1]|nr:histidine kinase [Okeania sp. SIO2D1]